MRTISGGLLSQLASETMTLALCFKIVREDGTQYFFTTHNENITFAGDEYRSDLSFHATNVDSKASLNVDNAELTLPLAVGSITKADVLANLFYRSSLDVFWVNWDDTTMGAIYEAKGWRLGKATLKEHKVVFEVRSLASFLNASIVDVVSPECPYVFGLDDGYDSKCPANLSSHQSSGQTTSVSSSEPQRVFTDTSRSEGSTLDCGKITWTSGNNAGYSMEIETYNTSTKQITLLLSMPYSIATGDTYSIWEGCDKSWSRCTAFGYWMDFGGEPFVPSKDKALQYQVA